MTMTKLTPPLIFLATDMSETLSDVPDYADECPFRHEWLRDMYVAFREKGWDHTAAQLACRFAVYRAAGLSIAKIRKSMMITEAAAKKCSKALREMHSE